MFLIFNIFLVECFVGIFCCFFVSLLWGRRFVLGLLEFFACVYIRVYVCIYVDIDIFGDIGTYICVYEFSNKNVYMCVYMYTDMCV